MVETIKIAYNISWKSMAKRWMRKGGDVGVYDKKMRGKMFML